MGCGSGSLLTCFFSSDSLNLKLVISNFKLSCFGKATKRMKIPILFFTLISILFSCKQVEKKNTEQTPEQYSHIIDSCKVETLSPLSEGEVSITANDFGEIIELQGTTQPIDQFFKVKETEMIALDSLLIVKNLGNPEVFMVFSIPDYKLIKSFGELGKGPGEFQFPSLVKDESGEFLCFIYEKAFNNLYALNKDLEILELPIELQKGKKSINDKQIYGLSSNDFVYVESIKMGKAIFRINSKNDTINTTHLKNLAFSNKHKNWAAYIGDFGVNGKKNRLVFAYKYFKRLVFFDLKNKTSKVISFDLPSKTKKGNAVSMMSPSNTTHYWGLSSNDKYVYILYSGRTPIDVSKELNKSSGYIYVEKFDWNGNPINKYKLDHWGYFCVNQEENTIYLASITDEYPFVSYKLPID